MLFNDIEAMDPNILLSIINMKLRNESRNFEDLCAYYNLDSEEIKTKLKQIDYHYKKNENQFK
ncbi:MAG: DUF4250 domain-containing protein [Clostridium sp.]|nr:DUF4250 domain-containing protein [Clostridium sp.]